MASQTKSPTSVVDGNVFGYGGLIWSDLTNMTASDDSYATVTGGVDGPYPNTPVCTGFGFTIPAGASIDKITVKIEGKIDPVDTTCIDWVTLMYGGNPIIMHASCCFETSDIDPNNPLTGSDVIYSINPVSAGDGDLWGVVWTPAMINATTFGCAFDATIPVGTTLSVDHVQITVDYTEDNAPEGVCLSRNCDTGYESVETIIRRLIDKATATDCAGIKIQPTLKSCEDLTDLVGCGDKFTLEQLFKAAITDDGCGGYSFRVWVLQEGRGGPQ